MKKGKCKRCKGACTLYNTDGSVVECPQCGGTGTEE